VLSLVLTKADLKREEDIKNISERGGGGGDEYNELNPFC